MPQPLKAKVYDPESILDIIDDFVSGGLEQGEIGSLGWNFTGETPERYGTALPEHPGIVCIVTTNVVNNYTSLHLTTPAYDFLIRFDKEWELTFIARLLYNTNIRVFLGAMVDFREVPDDEDRAGFEFDTSLGDTNWMMCTGDSVASTRMDSGIAVVGGSTFYKLKIKNLVTSYEFYIDGVLKGTISTTLPYIDIGQVGLRVETLTTAVRLLSIDFFRWRQAGITR